MAFLNKFQLDTFDFNTLPTKQWECKEKGLKKILISFNYESMTKATEISKCYVKISDVENLNDYETNYLNIGKDENKELWIELGTSITPIDYYIEIILQQMLIGEYSQCMIKTKKQSTDSDCIKFKLKLINIDFINYVYRLNILDIYNLALKYKENGVKTFKKYPNISHEYFSRAAKLLISYKPFDDLTEKSDGINPIKMINLLKLIQLNIAACLIKSKQQYENVIYLTQFVDNDIKDGVEAATAATAIADGSSGTSDAHKAGGDAYNITIQDKNLEKAIYRRAIAFYYLKKFNEAKLTLEKLKDFKNNKDFMNLYNKILVDWKQDTNKYNMMVKKMFG